MIPGMGPYPPRVWLYRFRAGRLQSFPRIFPDVAMVDSGANSPPIRTRCTGAWPNPRPISWGSENAGMKSISIYTSKYIYYAFLNRPSFAAQHLRVVNVGGIVCPIIMRNNVQALQVYAHTYHIYVYVFYCCTSYRIFIHTFLLPSPAHACVVLCFTEHLPGSSFVGEIVPLYGRQYFIALPGVLHSSRYGGSCRRRAKGKCCYCTSKYMYFVEKYIQKFQGS